MTTDPQSMREAIMTQFWEQLNQAPLQSVSVQILAAEVGCHHDDVYLLGGTIEQIMIAALDDMDSRALQDSAADFADAHDASVYDKILEGLIHRFEVFAPVRPAMQHIHNACLKNPVTAFMTANQLSGTLDRLLSLAGDQSTGYVRLMRRKGLAGVILKTRAVWQSDDSADLSPTLKALDKNLRQAQEWALSFRVLSADEDGAPVDEPVSED